MQASQVGTIPKRESDAQVALHTVCMYLKCTWEVGGVLNLFLSARSRYFVFCAVGCSSYCREVTLYFEFSPCLIPSATLEVNSGPIPGYRALIKCQLWEGSITEYLPLVSHIHAFFLSPDSRQILT